MAHRRDPEFAGQTDEFGNPITTYQTVPTGTGLTGGGLGAPGTTGAQGTFDPLGAPGTTGADPTVTGYDPSGGQGQLLRPTGAGGGRAHQQGIGRTGITTTEGYGTYETTGMGTTGGPGGTGTTGGHGGYDTGMGDIRGSGTAQDVTGGMTGGQTRVGLHRDTDREKKGMTERILEHLPGTGRRST